MSDTIEIDFGDVKDFAPIARNVPKGNYVLQVSKIEAGTSSNNNPMWIVDSSFVDGPNAGQTIREYLALTEKALFKVKSWLEALGIPIGKKKVKLPNTTAELTKKFVGKTYGAHVDEGDPYTNDKGETSTKSEVKYHMPAKEVAAAQAAAQAVTAPAPTPAPTPEPAVTPEPQAPVGDVADQLESFDLDDL